MLISLYGCVHLLLLKPGSGVSLTNDSLVIHIVWDSCDWNVTTFILVSCISDLRIKIGLTDELCFFCVSFFVELLQLVVSLWAGDGGGSYWRTTSLHEQYLLSPLPPAGPLSKLGGFHAIARNQQRDCKFMSVPKVGNQVYGIQYSCVVQTGGIE